MSVALGNDERECLSLIVAMDGARVIGADNGIPWHHREDMRHFRRTTLGHAVIMGRATFESIGKPLAKRRNIVVTRNRALSIDGCEVVHSLAEAVALAREGDAEPFVIGGAQLFREALPKVTRIYLTTVPGEHEGDTFFPALDPTEWRPLERTETEEGLVFTTLERKP